MSITQTATRFDYIATTNQTAFVYNWKILVSTDIAVVKNNVLLGTSLYSVSGVGDTTGGKVTLETGATAGDKVSVFLAMPITRSTNYSNSGSFLASTVNNDFDKVYSAAIQNSNTRYVKLNTLDQPMIYKGSPQSVDMTLPLASVRAGKIFGFDVNTGNPEMLDYSVGGTNVQILTIDEFTGTGSQTAFTLTDAPTSNRLLQISIDGLMQQVSSYSLSGLVVTFSEAPPLNSKIEVRKFIRNSDVVGDITAVVAGTGLTGGGTSGGVTLAIDSTVATLAGSQTFTNKTLTSPSVSGNLNILAQGDLRLQDASGGQYIAIQAPATVASNVTLTLPANDGNANQVLSTNGSGVLSWVTSGGLYNSWLVKTSAYTMLIGDQIVGNHASSAFTLTLPASPSAGAVVTVKNVGAALITIGRNSQKINSLANNALLPLNNAATLVFVDSTIGWTTI